MLTARDLRGLYAIIPTPATANAARYDALETVDLDETTRLVERLVADGVTGLITLGTTGECATLTNTEYEAFVERVLAVVAKRVPTFVGVTALGAHEVVRRMRFARERGADGVLAGMPMWQPCTVDMAVDYYRALSELFSSLPIMIYANARAFRFDFSQAEFWKRVVEAAPTVMSAKFSNANALLRLLEASRGRVHFLPHDDAVGAFAKLSPQTTTACWATAASMGPEPSLAVIRAILAGDRARADAVAADIHWAGEPLHDVIADAEVFASYNIQIEKARINAAGYCNAGPVRPPYDLLPDGYREQAEECGHRWRQLREKYRIAVAAS
jgi:dihydrodipicolinate synthase/N-acetylneuraminate lyase